MVLVKVLVLVISYSYSFSYSYLVKPESKARVNFTQEGLEKIIRGHGQVEPRLLPIFLSTPRRLETVPGGHVIEQISFESIRTLNLYV